MEENSRLEIRKLLEQELRTMAKNKPKKKVPVAPKRMTSAELFDNSEKCDKDVILMLKKRRAAKSPITCKEKNTEFDNGKKTQKKRRSVSPSIVKQNFLGEPTSFWKKSENKGAESPVAYKEPHKYWKRSEKRLYSDQITDFLSPVATREYYDYRKKSESRRSLESPVGSIEEYDYWKKSGKRRSFESPARDEFDYWKKSEKIRNIQSPPRIKYDYWKKYKKGHSTESPDRDEYNYWKKYEKRSIGSPAFKESIIKAPCDYSKKSEKRRSFESPTTSRKQSSDWKKYENKHVVDLRTLIKGKTSSDLTDNSKKYEKFLMIKKRHIAESPPASKEPLSRVLTDNLKTCKSRHVVKSREPDELFNYSKECGNILMVKKRHKVASPVSSEENGSDELNGNSKKSKKILMVKKRHKVASLASSEENGSDDLIGNAKKSKNILLVKERRKAKSPTPSGSSSVEIIEVKQPEKRPDILAVNEKPVSDNSYFATPVSSSPNFNILKSSIQHNECGSSESIVAHSTKFCENCKCLMAPNLNASPVNLNCSTPVPSNMHSSIGCISHNDAGFCTPSSFCNANIACSITGESFMPKIPQSGRDIRIVCTPSYPELSEKYNYFQNRRIVCTPNYSECFKFHEKYAYFKKQGMQKSFSPYHYYAPKEIQSQYTWKRPQSASTSQWQGQPNVTKEQLDNELDKYMSEVKFKEQTAKQDDVEPFVEEYMLEVEKCLNKHYTMDTFN